MRLSLQLTASFVLNHLKVVLELFLVIHSDVFLFSSIQGTAITSLRTKGVLHEFSAIQGVTEDIAEIILNLKSVRFKLHSIEVNVVP